MTKAIELHPDKIKISGPNMDNGFTVTLYIGEYETNQIAELVKLDISNIKKVTVEQDA